jgi:hypothetical protein
MFATAATIPAVRDERGRTAMRPLAFATLVCALVAFLPGCGSAHPVRLLEHDAEKWVAVFGKTSCSKKKLERDDDSKKSHHALTAQVDCDKLPAGPTRTDCYIGLAMIYRQQFEIAASVARRQRDIARHRRVTGDRSIKRRHP